MTMTHRRVRPPTPSAQEALDDEQPGSELALQRHRSSAKGVTKKDMQTSNLSIGQNYDKDGNITGYSVSNTVTVTLHDLSKAGDVIDAGAAAVGNDITLQRRASSRSTTRARCSAHARAERGEEGDRARASNSRRQPA